jgi:hypothetical protein
MDSDNLRGFCIFFHHFDFVNSLHFCQFSNFDVTDVTANGFDCILFYDDLQFVIFLGFISNLNQNNVMWRFI